MPRVALTSGAYAARSLTADAQRQINLYSEKNPEDSPFPFTNYPTPGLTLLATPTTGAGRGLYTATNGDLYGVVGSTLYYIDPSWTHHFVGSLITSGAAPPTNPVSMNDNGLVVCLVDGSVNGYSVTMDGRSWNNTIDDPAFYGADRVDFVDDYFLFNRPQTAEFYVSPSNWIPGVAFNPLWIASKTGSVDPLQGVVVMHAEPWLIGTYTSEVWYDAGAADFPFQRMPGVFVEHGCIAKYSFARQDLSIFWLHQDRQGNTMVLEGTQYQTRRISNHALEEAISNYATVSDAVGFTYQQQGHVFYVLIFPTADATWVYDVTTSALSGEPMWHQRGWTDHLGILHRIRPQTCANAYGTIVCQDWETGKLYKYDQNAFTDNGDTIVRIRSFPHLRQDAKRVNYKQFILDMEVGTVPQKDLVPIAGPPQGIQWINNSGCDLNFIGLGGAEVIFNGNPPAGYQQPPVSLRWSDDGGYSWGNPVTQTIGLTGQYRTTPTWWRTGMARRRVYEVSWSLPFETVLNGAYVEAEPCAT